MTDNREANREKIKELLREKPLATHVYFRRDDQQLVDVPILQSEFTLNNKPAWRVEALVGGEETFSPTATPEPELEVPPKPSEEAAPTSPAEPELEVPGTEAAASENSHAHATFPPEAAAPGSETQTTKPLDKPAAKAKKGATKKTVKRAAK